jgi:hypothetical protein
MFVTSEEDYITGYRPKNNKTENYTDNYGAYQR